MAENSVQDLGEVSPQLRSLTERYQMEARRTATQIGNLEIRKAQMLGALDALSSDLQSLINAESQRLGIPDGAQWQIDGNGHAIVVGSVPAE